MPSISLKVLLPAIAVLIGLQARAQVCTGSLGDPVINETFGAGSTFGMGPALPFTVTNYKYAPDNCPQDGFYTIATGLGNCGNAWDVVPHDHTGDPNGYMMIVNSSYDPGVFYTQRASGDKLCPGTTYEFAAWILNMIRGAGRPEIQPNITFEISTASGTLLKTYSTGDIPSENVARFHQYGTFFTTPNTGEDIIVKLINNAPGGNGNDLILDDITFRPCGPVITTGFGVIGQTAPRNICEGESASYTLKGEQVGYTNPVYQWQVYNTTSKAWEDVPNATTTTLNVSLPNAAAGVYQYRMGVLDGAGTAVTCRIYSAPLTINVNALPIIKLDANTSVCAGGELRLSSTGGVTYSWTGPNGFTSAESSPLIAQNAEVGSYDGVYTVTVTTDAGCVVVGSTTVKVLPQVSPTVSGDVTICAGSTTQLTATGGINYKWTPATGLDHDDVANPVASPTETTLYHLRVDNGACADESKTIQVTVLKAPSADAGKDIIIQEGESVQLKGTVDGDDISYYWTPAVNITDATSLTPTVSPIENTTYTLHAESQGSCGVASDDVFVRVYRKIKIPNTFSPNNDGINDLWNIDKLVTYPESMLTIYTRAGREVFKTKGAARAWDGLYGGQQLPAGVYYYVIDLKNNTPKRSGWVMLLR